MQAYYVGSTYQLLQLPTLQKSNFDKVIELNRIYSLASFLIRFKNYLIADLALNDCLNRLIRF